MGRLRCGGLAALAVLLAAAPAAAAGPKRFWAKPDTSGAAMAREYDECVLESKDVHANVSGGDAYAGAGLAGVVGEVIGEAIASSIEEHSARGGYIRRCMHGRGYFGIVLTDDELVGYNAVKTSQDRAAWAERTYGATGFSERLRRAMQPPVPPLPEGRAEPATFGALRFDPATLAPAAGLVSPGQPALSGLAGHRRTAKVRETFLVPGEWVKVDMAAGAVMQEVIAPSQENPNQVYWCGVAKLHSLTGLRDFDQCFWSDEDGYVYFPFWGQPWLAGGVAVGEPVRMPTTQAILIDPSPTDLLPPMDFAIVVSKIGKAAVTLQAKATMKGKSVVVWTGDVAFDPEGRAVLPFWSHRLVLTRSGAGLTTAFAADGDGTGWEAIPPAS